MLLKFTSMSGSDIVILASAIGGIFENKHQGGTNIMSTQGLDLYHVADSFSDVLHSWQRAMEASDWSEIISTTAPEDDDRNVVEVFNDRRADQLGDTVGHEDRRAIWGDKRILAVRLTEDTIAFVLTGGDEQVFHFNSPVLVEFWGRIDGCSSNPKLLLDAGVSSWMEWFQGYPIYRVLGRFVKEPRQ